MRYVNPKDYEYVDPFVPLDLNFMNQALIAKQGEYDKQESTLLDTKQKLLALQDGYQTQGYSKAINADYEPKFNEILLSGKDLTSPEIKQKTLSLISDLNKDQRIKTLNQDFTVGNPFYDKYAAEKDYALAIDPNKDNQGNIIQIPMGQPFKQYNPVLQPVDNMKIWKDDLSTLAPKIVNKGWTNIDYINGDYLLTDEKHNVTSLNIADPETAKIINGYVENYYNQGIGSPYWKAYQKKHGMNDTKTEMAKQIFRAAAMYQKSATEDVTDIKIQNNPNSAESKATKSAATRIPEPDMPIAYGISKTEGLVETANSGLYEVGTDQVKTALNLDLANFNQYLTDNNFVDADKQPVFDVVQNSESGELNIVPKANATEEQINRMNTEEHDHIIEYNARINKQKDAIAQREDLITKAKEDAGVPIDYKPNTDILKESDYIYTNSLISDLKDEANLYITEYRSTTTKDLNNPNLLYYTLGTTGSASPTTGVTTTSVEGLQGKGKTREQISKETKLKDAKLDEYLLSNYYTYKSFNEVVEEAQNKNVLPTILTNLKDAAYVHKFEYLKNADPILARYEESYQKLYNKDLVPENGFRFGYDEESQKFKKEIEESQTTRMLNAATPLTSFDGTPIIVDADFKDLKPEEQKLNFSYWRQDGDQIVLGFQNNKINNGSTFEIADVQNIDNFLVKTGKMSQVKAMYLSQLESGFKETDGDHQSYIGLGNQRVKVDRALFNIAAKNNKGLEVKKGQYMYTIGGVKKTAESKSKIINDYIDYYQTLNNGVSLLENYLKLSDAEFKLKMLDLPEKLRNKQAIITQIEAYKEKLGE